MTRTEYVERLCELSAKVEESAKEFRLLCQSLPEANSMTKGEWEIYDKVLNAFDVAGDEMRAFQDQYSEVFRKLL